MTGSFGAATLGVEATEPPGYVSMARVLAAPVR
jgi:hypothetical protein